MTRKFARTTISKYIAYIAQGSRISSVTFGCQHGPSCTASDGLLTVSDVASRQHHHSASRRLLVVPHHHISKSGCRAFAVADPMVWTLELSPGQSPGSRCYYRQLPSACLKRFSFQCISAITALDVLQRCALQI